MKLTHKFSIPIASSVTVIVGVYAFTEVRRETALFESNLARDSTLLGTSVKNLETNADFRLELLPPTYISAEKSPEIVTIVHFSQRPSGSDKSQTVTVLHGDPFLHALEPGDGIAGCRICRMLRPLKRAAMLKPHRKRNRTTCFEPYEYCAPEIIASGRISSGNESFSW